MAVQVNNQMGMSRLTTVDQLSSQSRGWAPMNCLGEDHCSWEEIAQDVHMR